MRVYCKTTSAILLFACLIFFSGVAFAQNIDALKSDIHSKLKCCTCQVSFDKCTCFEAKEMKAYIDALIDSSMSKEEIFYKFAKRYSPNAILDEQIKADAEQRLIKEAGSMRPEVILDSSSFDFGKVTKKQGKISKVFRLTNKGNESLIIRDLKTSCPCASVSLKVDKNKSQFFTTAGAPADWQMEINPQQLGELELMVDLASPHVKTGKLIREATVTSNDPVYPDIAVRIEAEVLE